MGIIIPSHAAILDIFILNTFQNLVLKSAVYYIAMSQDKLTEEKQTELLWHKSRRQVLLQFRRHCDNPAQGDNTQKNPWPHLCSWRGEPDIKWTDCLLAFKLYWSDTPPPQLQSHSNKRYLHKICIGSPSLLPALTLSNSLGELSFFR